MSVPNTRISRLTLDLNLATNAQVGASGLALSQFTALAPRAMAAHDALVEAHASGKLGFMKLPEDHAAKDAAKAIAQDLIAAFDDQLVLGIGGSSLGGKALFTSLCHPFHNQLPKDKRPGLRTFFPDNSDGTTFARLLEVSEASRSAIVAITKSGGTAETWAQLLYLNDKLGAAAMKKQVVAVTDPTKGALRAVATTQGWRTLPVPPNIGGRFSVFTAVGLLPAAAAGIDVDQLLAGAAAMTRRCSGYQLFDNPAYLLASALYLFDKERGRPLHVFMPYADALRETGDWFVQLWAESLGKKNHGPTPLRAVGATDQHSLLQLLMEGPNDKVNLFVVIEEPRVDLPIPNGFRDQADVKYLNGLKFHTLLNAEQQATAAALAVAGRPSLTITLPKLDAFAMGELMMMLEIATGFVGSLYGIDPYDQPGVEAGKRYACGLLGRPGYEDAKDELHKRPKADPAWVV
jgi:glucose-6-phosphate isomerase